MTPANHQPSGIEHHFTSDRSVRNLGLGVVLITFGFFGAWAAFAPLDSSAVASGVVVVKSHKKTIQHMDGGIIAKILVKDGDEVSEGQTLLLLDDTQLKAQLEIARSQNIAYAAAVARLESERDQLKQVRFPDWLATSDDPRAITARETESNIFVSHKNNYEGKVALINQRINQISSKINGLQDQVASKKRLMASFDEEIKELNELIKDGFADKLRLREIERSHALQGGEIASLSAEIATNQMMISEARIEILQTQKEFQERVAEKLSETQAQLNSAVEQVTANSDKLKRVAIKSPVNGIVQGLNLHTEGGVVTTGTPILDIVPHDAELVVDAKVNPLDIDRVTAGLTAEVRFTAFKMATTPKMTGKVVRVSADRFVENNDESKAYYLARVELTPESRKDLGKLQLVPGMVADVLINTGERTLVQYLAKPFTDALRRAFTED